MILLIPKPRLCEGRQTKYPITGVNPFFWIKKDDNQHLVLSIDGYIVTQAGNVNGIFKKFEFTDATDEEDVTIDDIQKICSVDEIKTINLLASILECSLHAFVWPIDFPKGYDVSRPLIQSFTFEFQEEKVTIRTHKRVTIKDLESGISKLRQRSFSTVKSLNSASSNLECYLANNTRDPWPGDIDAILFDKEQQKFRAIIEFKTHNGYTPVENEHIGKYGHEDWRRFNVLFDLIDNFQAKQGYRPKLFFIVWGTNPNSQNHQNIKIDEIERNKVIKTHMFPRPAYNAFSQSLFDFIIEQCNSGQ